ncbi:MAG: hypothetical protein WCK85_08670 [Chlorobium sp.]
MKKYIWLAAGITGMLLGNPSADAQAEVSIRIGGGRPPSFVLDTRPSFIELPGMGFSVSIGSPYDILYYGDMYYIIQDGVWYRSAYYRGPWIVVRERNLPYKIRRHRWDDIRRTRDVEYRKYEYRDNRDRRDNRDYRDNDNRRDNRFNAPPQMNRNVPNQPNHPGQPNIPSQPNHPGQPNIQNQPIHPGQPNQPNTLNQPNSPNQPYHPGQPKNPNDPNDRNNDNPRNR